MIHDTEQTSCPVHMIMLLYCFILVNEFVRFVADSQLTHKVCLVLEYSSITSIGGRVENWVPWFLWHN